MTLPAERPYAQFSERLFNAGAEAARPVKAQFEITYRCNLRCLHCYTDPYNNPRDVRRELALDEVYGILDQLSANGVLWLSLTGGEAAVHPHFQDIYRRARNQGFIVSLLTNVVALTDPLIDFLAAHPPFQLDISMHGASDAVFDGLTQVRGSYDRFQRNLQQLHARGLPLKIKTNALRLNRQELPAIRAFVESLGLDFNLNATIQPRLNGDLSSLEQRLSAPEILALEADALEDPCGSLSSTAGEGTPEDDRLFRCGCGTNSVTIDPYGRMRACTFTTSPTYDLLKIPFHEAFAQLAAAIQSARYAGSSPCRVCPVYALCDKHPVTAAYEAGAMEAPVQHHCELAYGRRDLLTTR